MTDLTPEQIAAVLPEPWLSVCPGDMVTVYVNKMPPDFPVTRLPDFLRRYAPEVSWLVVEGTGVTGVVHVSRCHDHGVTAVG